MRDDHRNTASALASALADADPWDKLLLLVQEMPVDLVRAARACYPDADPTDRRRLTWMLERVTDNTADDVLLELLSTAVGEEATDVLNSATRRKVAVPKSELLRFLDDKHTRRAAVDAAGVAGYPELIPRLQVLLKDPTLGDRAALALGRMRATSATTRIAKLLPTRKGLEFFAFAVALELMADPAAIPILRRQLDNADARRVSVLHNTLAEISGREPVINRYEMSPEWAEQVREAWSRLDTTRPAAPRISDIVVRSAGWAGFTVHDGLGTVRLAYDTPSPDSSWPRWDKSLVVAGQPVYHAGSDCGTCESLLRLSGWPEHRAAEDSAQLRAALRHVPELTPELLEALSPLLTCLRTGHHVVLLGDLDLEPVHDPDRSWWNRRAAMREFADDSRLWDEPSWPGTPHWQLRTPIPAERPTFGVVMPTQPPESLNDATRSAYLRAIADGERPAAILMGWVEERWIEGDAPERFLLTAVLDGHHKLHAYAHTDTPARALIVLRADDSWPENPTDAFTPWISRILEPLSSTHPAR